MNDFDVANNSRVLIVDDNAAIHDDFRKVLSPPRAPSNGFAEADAALFGDRPAETARARASFHLDSAHQGQDAFALVQKAHAEGHPYAMAFMDVRMPPGWDGIETTQRIWEIDSEIQIVLCTAFSDYSWDQMLERFGENDRLVILKKPFDNVEVMQLAYAMTHKWTLQRQAHAHVSELEEAIAARTQEWRRSDQRYRSVLENIREVVFQTDKEGHWTLLNRAWEEITGFPVTGSLGTSFLEFVHPEDRARNLELFRSLLEGKQEHRQHEVRYLTKDGGIRWLEEHSRRTRNDADGVDGMAGTLRDITLRKQAEQERQRMEIQLRQAQKLESIGQLAAGIAHEINTPTQFIGDNTHFLRDAFADVQNVLDSQAKLLAAVKLNEATPELITAVENAVQAADLAYLATQVPRAIQQSLDGVSRVSKIVGAMKEFSHPGSDKKSAVDINHGIESTITVCRNEWKYVAELVLELDPTLPPVCCLPGEINQTILNIVVNAAHAIADVVKEGEKGAITIRTRHEGGTAEIRISDTGSGIPVHARDRIFDPFFTTKEVGKGTGQGLAIAHSVVVDKHGGALRFETELGRGTTFVIRLPISEADVKKGQK